MLFHSPYKTLNCPPDLLSITKTLHCTMCTLGSMFTSQPNKLKHILKFEDQPLVSVDFNGNDASSIVDGLLADAILHPYARPAVTSRLALKAVQQALQLQPYSEIESSTSGSEAPTTKRPKKPRCTDRWPSPGWAMPATGCVGLR